MKEGSRVLGKLAFKLYNKASSVGVFKLGLIGLNIAAVCFALRELLPNRMKPTGLFSESLDQLSQNKEVTSRIGEPIHGYGFGHDYGDLGEGPRNYFEHVHLKDKDGNLRLRIKYNIEGPSGHAFVFAEVNHNMKKGEYVYLILQFTKSGEIVKIIDNRKL